MDDDTDERDDTKRRSRNLSEKKRRDQFNSLVNDLSALISSSNRKMDKSTVLKSTIAFLKHHNEATDRSKVFEIQQDWKPSFLSNDEFTQLMLESLDGFIIVFGSRGPIFYTSDSVTAQLGYLPSDLTKMTIFDLSYEMDHDSLLNIFLNPKPVIEPMQTDISTRNQISFSLHLRRGGIEDRDSNLYELVKFVGYFRNDANVDVGGNSHASLPHILQRNAKLELDSKLIFVGTGRLQMPQMIREITVMDPTCNEFTSKHSMEWKFLFLDHRAPPIIGYMPFEVLGTSGYDYYHFDDIDDLVTCHEELMQTGKGKSSYYRFLTKGQQWIWLQTDFYISYNQFSAKPDYVVCTHKVITYTEVLKYHKLSTNQKTSSLSASQSVSNSKSTALTSLDLTQSNAPADSVSLTGNISNAAATASAVTTVTSSNVLTVSGANNLCNNANVLGEIISNETSPSMDTSTLWTNPPTPTGAGTSHLQPIKSHSRAASSYGNISSTGISPNVKRKRYMYNCRGNESDSTSMSADSGTSRQSLMTHISSSRHRLASGVSQSNYSGIHHHHSSSTTNNQHHPHMQQQQHQQQHNHHHHHHQQQQQQQQEQGQQQQQQQHHRQLYTNSQGGQSQAQRQKMFSGLTQHAIVSNSPIAGAAACQFPQPAFPMRSQQIVGPSFIETSQCLAALPVQPVIAPFQVASVLSPLPVTLCPPPVNTDTGIGSFSSSSCFIKNQSDMIAAPVVMTSTQSHLQEQLQQRHDELQKIILQQQDELRIVSEQLLLARYTLLQPMMSMNYSQTEPGAMGNTSRSFNFNHNGTQQQFNQYGFAMNTSEVQQQQMLMQQQQNLQQQMQHNQANQQQTQHHHQQQQHEQQQQQQQPASQQPHINSQQSNAQHSSQQLHQQQKQQLHQQHDQLLTNRNLADLDHFAQDEFDAFLNLSPLNSLVGSQTTLTQINSAITTNTPAINNNNQSTCVSNNANNSTTNNINRMQTSSYKPTSNNPSEDSLFSYMQIATASSPTLNFPLNMNDGIPSEPQDYDTKILPNTSRNHQQQQQQQLHQLPEISPTRAQRQQQQSPTFFPAHPFSSIPLSSQSPSANTTNVNNSNGTTGGGDTSANNIPLSNELNSLLPYQLEPEQSQNLFISNSQAGQGNQ